MKLQNQKFNKRQVQKIPQSPGVYIFQAENGKPLYIGKSINIKKRVLTYFAKNLAQKTSRMVKEVRKFSFIVVNSEIESLLLEAHLVKKYKPVYNSALKDDKHPLYIKITREKYPRVLTARKNDLSKTKNKAIYGPFPSAKNVKYVLKMLRRIFPFSEHEPGKRACLYNQIGLCQPCPNEIEKEENKDKRKNFVKEYNNNLSNINRFLGGKIKFVQSKLDKQMKLFSKQQEFEKAAKIREKIEKIDYITQPVTPIKYFVENPNLIEDIREEELRDLGNILSQFISITQPLRRIECYDVAHISGSKPTASMVTFINGDPDKNYYRHFRIRQKKGQDDIASLNEVAKRRKKYLASWGIPDLIVVDGGKGQVSTFYKEFKAYKIPLVGLAKKREQLVIPKSKNDKISFNVITLTPGGALNLLQRIRNEAHRFARRLHYKLLKKALIPS